MTPRFLIDIRNQTRHLHVEIEQVTEGARLLHGPFEASFYARFLSSHLLYHLEVAGHLDHWAAKGKTQVLDWPNCSRIAGLKEDLSVLDYSLPELTLQNDFRSFPFALGLCYVSEGSSMGNKQIFAALMQQDGFESCGASSFFKSSTTNFGQRWKAFQEILEEEAAPHFSELLAGVEQGYKSFQANWLLLAHPAH